MLLVILLLSINACQKNKVIEAVSSSKDNIAEKELIIAPKNTDKVKIETFHSDTTGWGFDIFVEGKKYIHQPHIPSINGIKGFNSEQDAIKVANLMAKKIEQKIMPPSISRIELDSLKILIHD